MTFIALSQKEGVNLVERKYYVTVRNTLGRLSEIINKTSVINLSIVFFF